MTPLFLIFNLGGSLELIVLLLAKKSNNVHFNEEEF